MICFEKIPIHTQNAARQDVAIRYVDLTGDEEGEVEDFLFTFGDQGGMMKSGNIQTLRGAEKTGKSAFGLMLMAAAIKGEFLGIKPIRRDLRILWIDTEQSIGDVRKKGRAVLSMAETTKQPDGLVVASVINNYCKEDALKAVLQAIDDNAPDFVFLDGIVDLCNDFNSETEGEGIVLQLQRKAAKYNAAILCVIHTNKNDDSARGHLGSALQRKGTEVYQVNKQIGESIATITRPNSRYGELPDIKFAFADNFEIEPAGAVLAKEEEAKIERLRGIFGEVFNTYESLNKKDLAHEYGDKCHCGERTADSAIAFAVDKGILHKEKNGKEMIYTYLFPKIVEADDGDL